MRHLLPPLLLALGGLLLAPHRGAAQSSAVLDPTFGTAGRTYTGFTAAPTSDVGSDVALLPDGRLVVAGYGPNGIELARYTSAGALDPTFGTGGKVTSRRLPTTVAGAPCSSGGLGNAKRPVAFSLLRQPDGKLVVAGGVLDTVVFGPSLVLWTVHRFLPDGSSDPGFGPGGAPYGRCGGSTGGSAYKVLRQSTGRLLVLGVSTGLNSRNASVVGLTGSGTVDSTFPEVAVGTNYSLRDGWVDAQDRIWLLGTSQYMPSNGGNWTYQRLVMYRLLPNGQFDPSFGTNGEVQLNVGNTFTTARCFTPLASGQVVVAGLAATGPSGSYQPYLARFNANGTLDAGFGTAGIATPRFEAFKLAEQADGKLLLASGNNFALSRCLATGQPDPGYGANGVAAAPEGAASVFNSLVLQADGKAVAVGTLYQAPASQASQSSSSLLAVLRFNPDPTCTNVTAGPDRSACGGSTIALEGRGQDGLSYSWSVSPAIAGFSATTLTPSVTLPAVSATTVYTFTLAATVAGNAQCAPTSQVQVTAYPRATPQPTASPTTVSAGQSVTLSVPAPQAGYTYAWSGPGLAATTGPTVTATPPATTNTARYTVTATLGTCSAAASVQVGVQSADRPNWSWATAQQTRSPLTDTYSQVQAVVSDPAGGAYVAGWFQDSTTLGGTITLKGGRKRNLFVARYDGAGAVQWATRLTSLSTGLSTLDIGPPNVHLALGGAGQLYLAANFADSIRLAGTAKVLTRGGQDVLLAQLSTTGTVVWSKGLPVPTSRPYIVRALRADAQGNVYVAGQLYPASGSSKYLGYITRLTPAGATAWLQYLTGSDEAPVHALALDDQGGLAFAAGGKGPITLGPLTVSGTVGGSSNWVNVVGKLDAQQGTPQWMQQVNASYGSMPLVAAGPGGSVLFGFDSDVASVTFTGATAATTQTIPRSAASADVYLARYSGSGDLEWARRVSTGLSGNATYLRALRTQGGAAYLAGQASGTINYGASTLPSSAAPALYVAKYAVADGANQWVQQSGSGQTRPTPDALAVDAQGSAYVGGVYFASTAAATGAGFGPYWLPAGVTIQGFLARLGAAPAVLAATPAAAAARLWVYPNPSHGADWQLAAEGLSLRPTEAVQVRVLTSLGQPVYEATLAADQLRQLRLATSQLAAGRYFVQLQTPAGSLYRQVEVR